MKLRVEPGKHYSLPFLVGSKIFKKFREVAYLVTDWSLEYPYENTDSLDQNKLLGINLRAFKSSNVDSVMLSSAHDSRKGITTFAAYANNSEKRTDKNPMGYEIRPLFELENGRLNGLGENVDSFEVLIYRKSFRYVGIQVDLYSPLGNHIKKYTEEFRISRKAAKSKWFRTIQLWFGGNNVAPVEYSIKYDRDIL